MKATLFGAGAAVCLATGLAISGWQVSSAISSAPTVGAVTRTLPGQTVMVNHTQVVKKVVRGRVVTLKSGQHVVMVPTVVIHNLRCHPTRRHHCVRRVVVPAHTIPLKAATVHQAVAIAAPSMPVTVTVTVTEPAKTITLPPQTVTQTQTQTSTITQIFTVTVTCTPPECLPNGRSHDPIH